MQQEFPKEIKSQEEYLKIFQGDKRKEALKTALETRKFEIDLYWKRATYFWAFIAATFAAYFLLLNSNNNAQFRGFSIVIAAIGFFFSLGWYFVNRGSKHWQENWETHVYLLEQSIQGPLFSYVKVPEVKFTKITGAFPFSVSKVNQLLSFMMIIFWLGAFVFSIFFSFNKLVYFDNLSDCKFWFIGFSLLAVLFFISFLFGYKSLSFLKKEENISNSMQENKDLFTTKKKIFKENTMVSGITMGNDEFILYIRKQTKTCAITNDQLGKLIWIWLRDRGAKKTEDDKLSIWGKFADNTNEIGLPKTATQFEFDRALLPQLYNYLDELTTM